MKRVPNLTRRGFLLVPVLAVAAGCRIRSEALSPRTFVLRAPSTDRGGTGEGVGVLLLRSLRVAPAFDSRAFVLRRGESEFTSDAYHGFLLSPGSMLTEALRAWLSELGVFRMVTTGGSQVAATHALEGEVTELYGDFREAAAPRAVLSVQLRLLHPLGGSAPVILWQGEERRVVPLPQAGAEALVGGWNTALAQICRAFETAFLPRPPSAAQPQA